jgi:hypothetical protein
MTEYFGKYRGKVINNVDPMKMGRLMVACPFVLGPAFNWAMPCLPFAGMMEGFFMMPTIGANVWIEFEQGDPNRPIWSGGFWDPGMVPVNAQLPTTRTIKTLATELTLDDLLGIKLQVMPPAAPVPCTISLGPTGIEITVGAASIKLDPARVTVNDGALEVI